jgi:hypothetical protein
MPDTINDGGFVYPFAPPCDAEGRMAAGYPFPEMGMTLRDAAALAALQGFCAHTGSYGYKNGPHEIASRAWEIADAFIAAREGKTDAQ